MSIDNEEINQEESAVDMEPGIVYEGAEGEPLDPAVEERIRSQVERFRGGILQYENGEDLQLVGVDANADVGVSDRIQKIRYEREDRARERAEALRSSPGIAPDAVLARFKQ